MQASMAWAGESEWCGVVLVVKWLGLGLYIVMSALSWSLGWHVCALSKQGKGMGMACPLAMQRGGNGCIRVRLGVEGNQGQVVQNFLCRAQILHLKLITKLRFQLLYLHHAS